MPKDINKIKAYVSQEQGFWVANLIDFDIAVQAKTLDGLIENIVYAVETEIVISNVSQEQGFWVAKENNLDFFERSRPAPKEYIDAYKNSQFRGFYAAIIDKKVSMIECRLADSVIRG